MKVLILNCGSSSIKYQIFDGDQNQVIEKGVVARIGEMNAYCKRVVNGQEYLNELAVHSYQDAFDCIFQSITDPVSGVISDLSEIHAVGHRTAHGGATFSESVVITEETIKQIEENIPLAPLHNPMNLMGIRIASEILPHAVQVAVFDTSFHHALPKKVRVFPIPYEYFDKYGIQKIGFHSQSYRYVLPEAAKLVGKAVDELKVIICHLGSGATMTAIDNGNSVDTSVGFSSFAGLMMGTRPGDFDPGLIFYLHRELGMPLEEIEEMIFKKSGLLGVSGVSNDMGTVILHAEKGNERCRLAVEMFCYQVKKFIGAFIAALGGLDLLVFTAGIGENSPEIREQICSGLEFFGIALDGEKNQNSSGMDVISPLDSKIQVLVVPTNEEQIIINDTLRIYHLEKKMGCCA